VEKHLRAAMTNQEATRRAGLSFRHAQSQRR